MDQLTHKPHLKNVKSGINLHDPDTGSIFEMYFQLPKAIQSEFKEDEATLTQQVISVSGLDALQKVPGASSQKFFGVDASYSNPYHDNTYADLTVTLNLNLRNVTDNWVLKVFKAWAKLAYDITTGERSLMVDYCSDSLSIAEANRDGTIWRTAKFYKTFLTGISGLDDVQYGRNEARTIQVTFRSDYWDEDHLE